MVRERRSEGRSREQGRGWTKMEEVRPKEEKWERGKQEEEGNQKDEKE